MNSWVAIPPHIRSNTIVALTRICIAVAFVVLPYFPKLSKRYEKKETAPVSKKSQPPKRVRKQAGWHPSK